MCRWAIRHCTISSSFVYHYFQYKCLVTILFQCLLFSFLQISHYFLHFTQNAFPNNSTDGKPPCFSRTISVPWTQAKSSFLILLKIHIPTVYTIHPGFMSLNHVPNCLSYAWSLRPKEPCAILFLSIASIKTSFISKAFNGPIINFFSFSLFFFLIANQFLSSLWL